MFFIKQTLSGMTIRRSARGRVRGFVRASVRLSFEGTTRRFVRRSGGAAPCGLVRGFLHGFGQWFVSGLIRGSGRGFLRECVGGTVSERDRQCIRECFRRFLRESVKGTKRGLSVHPLARGINCVSIHVPGHGSIRGSVHGSTRFWVCSWVFPYVHSLLQILKILNLSLSELISGIIPRTTFENIQSRAQTASRISS